MKKNTKIISFLAFSLYFLTGAACLVVGSSLPQLVEMYNLTMDKVVLLSSSYALGRVSTVYLTGRMVEKIGPIKVLTVGIILISIFLIGIPTIQNYYIGLLFAFLGGVGMGSQDTVCPMLLSLSFKDNNYASSLSAGQALFGLGTFTTPFLVGYLLSNQLPFYGSYYALLIVPAIMLICVPFAKLPNSSDGNKKELIIPLYSKNKFLSYMSSLIVCATYSAAFNVLGLYMSSFGESIGMDPATSAYLLTIYNIGAVVGSLIFIVILRNIKAQNILIFNTLMAGISLIISMVVNKAEIYYLFFFVTGLFLGVLFSVIIAIATRIGYQRISVAGSLVATASGASDIFTPIVTGILIMTFGIRFSLIYALIMILVACVFAIILKINVTENKIES
ncbi:MAG: MFS transporter [Erysipelotrichales bacterium]|nr:MFS transporter [Erysipelotrichales bacterium]